jgi:L-ascorbate metabolism protein UlaG (beta-lactamase superfamily)
MKIQLIRNATLRMKYAGHKFIIDPFLAVKHSLPSYAGKSPNPLVDLPIPGEQVIEGIEMVIISHLHGDHFDEVAQEMLPKDLPFFCQPGNENQISEKGFLDVTPIEDLMQWNGISIRRVPGRHGTSKAILRMMGKVSGFVFSAENEPTVYWAGDTVWYEDVEKAIDLYQPEIIITHSGGAVWGQNEFIIMDAEQTINVCEKAPDSLIIAVHLDALDHCVSSRKELQNLTIEKGISSNQLLIPTDGEIIEMSLSDF